METNDLINIISIAITFLLGIISTVLSIKNSKKIKDMETYKHSLKMKELRIDTRYKNNQAVMLEVHVLLTNIKNLSCKSDCYLFRDNAETQVKYRESIIEARESLIWVQRQVNTLSVYMDREIYFKIKELFKLIRELLEKIEKSNNYNDFLEDVLSEYIGEIEEKGLDIIQKIQDDNEKIIDY